MTLLSRGIAWFADKLPEAAGRSVTLSRGPLVSAAITATVTMHVYDVADEDGFSTSITAFEWTFTTDDLPYAPRRGDVITETLGGETVTYEVLPVAGKPDTEWLDTAGVLTLVRTKKIS